MRGSMLAVLAKVKTSLRLNSDVYSRHIFRREVTRNKLSLARNVTTSSGLCAKVRGSPKKTDLSEKKLV